MANFTQPVARYGSKASAAHDPLEDSLLKRAGSSVLSGAARVGNVLDLPGSMVRDALTWLPGGPKPENPFDQLLSPTTHENRTTGRDLLRGYGLAGRKDTWGNFGGGIAAEMALDPLTYLTFGGSALARSGQVAKKAGLLDDVTQVAASKAGQQLGSIGPRQSRMSTTLEDLIAHGDPATHATRQQAAETAAEGMGLKYSDLANQKLGGNVGVGIPFMEPAGTLGNSERVASFFDRWSVNPLDPGSKWLGNIPKTEFGPVREFYRLFDSSIKEAETPMGRELARSLTGAEDAGRARARGLISEYANRLEAAGGGIASDIDELRRIAELPDYRANAAPEVRDLFDNIETELSGILQRSQDLGLGVEELMDPMLDAGMGKYFPRQLNQKITDSISRNELHAYQAFDPGRIQREGHLKGIEGMTDSINTIGRDAQINDLLDKGAATKKVREALLDKYGTLFKETDPETGAMIARDASVLNQDANRLIDLLRKVPRGVREEGIFGNHPLVDLQSRLLNAEDAIASAEHIYKGLLEPGVLKRGVAGRDGVRLGDVLGKEGAGFTVAKAKEVLADRMGVSARSLDKYVVDPKVAADLKRFRKAVTMPESASNVMQVVDSVTNLWKSSLTTPFPAFHVRNLISGQWNNVLDGTFSADSVAAAQAMMRGQTVTGAAQIPAIKKMAQQRGIANLDDATATKLLGELVYSHSIVGKFQGEVGNVVGKSINQRTGMDDILEEIMGPGREQINAARTAKRAVGAGEEATWNPFDAEYRGFRGGQDSTWGPMAAGQDFGHYIEGLNRVAPFIQQIKKGIDPGVAARKVAGAQVEYGNKAYTKFQQSVVNRALPFSKFTQGMIPWTLRKLVEEPGGKLGQTVRMMNRLHDPNSLTPDYVSETASVPIEGTPLEYLIGKGKPGNDRYLTGFGLAIEDPLSFAGGNGIRGTLQEAGSRMNPFLKAPTEWAFGSSLFQKGPHGGRPLEDMDPLIGRTIANVKSAVTGEESPRDVEPFLGMPGLEHIVANSPLARVLSTVRTATDPRKTVGSVAANLGTGFRVSDISEAQQEGIARERMQDVMRDSGALRFEVVRFSKDQIAKVSESNPELAAEMQQYNAILNALSQKAKARAKKTD